MLGKYRLDSQENRSWTKTSSPDAGLSGREADRDLAFSWLVNPRQSCDLIKLCEEPGIGYRVWIGKDIEDYGPINDIPRITHCPVFLIHGTGDQMIPFTKSEKLRDASNGAALWLLEDLPMAGHAGRQLSVATEGVLRSRTG